MYCTIKDLKYIKKDDVIYYYIKQSKSHSINSRLVSSISNLDKITINTKFKPYDYFKLNVYDKFGYVVLVNDDIVCIVRQDNISSVEEDADVLSKYGFAKLIKSGNKTILIDEDDYKYMTTRQSEDKDDPEKAIMILLLKANGYTIDDVYKLVNLIK